MFAAYSRIIAELPEKVKNVSCAFILSEHSILCTWYLVTPVKLDTKYFAVLQDHRMKKDFEVKNGQIFGVKTGIMEILNITITARNNVGKTTSDVLTFHSFPSVKIDAPKITSVRVTSSSLTVAWQVQEGIHFDLRCQLKYRKTNVQQWTQVPPMESQRESNYTIRELEPFNNYSVSVSCVGISQIYWSEWAEEKTAKTLEDAPRKAVDVWQFTESSDAAGRRRVHLVWKELDSCSAQGNILGYIVRCKSKEHFCEEIQANCCNTSVSITAESYIFEVFAYNSVGNSPGATLQIPEENWQDITTLKEVWAFPENQSFWVNWTAPDESAVSEYVVEWCVDTEPCTRDWQHVKNSTASFLQAKFLPFKCYNISVYPIYESRSGKPKTTQVYLKEAAPKEGPSIKETGVTKTEAIIKWEPIKKEKQHGFILYYAISYNVSEQRFFKILNVTTLEYKLHSLTPGTEYIINVKAVNSAGESGNVVVLTTLYLSFTDIIVIAICTTLIFLCMGTFCIARPSKLQKYLWSSVPNPSKSILGKWLVEYRPKKEEHWNVLPPHHHCLQNCELNLDTQKYTMSPSQPSFTDLSLDSQCDHPMLLLPNTTSHTKHLSPNTSFAQQILLTSDYLVESNISVLHDCTDVSSRVLVDSRHGIHAAQNKDENGLIDFAKSFQDTEVLQTYLTLNQISIDATPERTTKTMPREAEILYVQLPVEEPQQGFHFDLAN
ncbi:interleukin-6 receptor subunit beta-like isoform X1 [Erpetoichthys calabaricus]|uniref:interleukin-6 receptor subunit beta-like isoform X1 n=1 Tax=Erpetoichthys calabaricus TaxID=27687 RepID=UPI002233F581|nr:interleukin-6 receptor subunit beta-like isoform X1 [Erpetoichthys calabaricus]